MLVNSSISLQGSKRMFLLVCLFFVASISYLAFFVPRENFWLSYSLIVLSFILFYLAYNLTDNFNWLFLLGLLLRIILLFSIPELSDDFYRFLWDGAVTDSGQNPFLYKPSEVLLHDWLREDFKDKFHLLNSPNYYTVYPPFIQLVDFISVCLGKTFSGSLVVMKFIFLLGELCSFYFLKKLLSDSAREKQVYLFWLCPLVVIEFMGNLHFEAFMITFILAAFWYFKQEKWFFCALFFSLAFYTKLVPLAFFPFFVVASSKKIKFTLFTVLFLLVGSIPVIFESGYLYVFESVKLYFGSFEFNSGIAYLGQKYKYTYPSIFYITKCFSVVTLVGSFVLFYFKKFDFRYAISLFYFVYLLFSQSVHPWYVIPLIPLFLMKEIPKSLWVWVLLIPLSYITYETAGYEQKEWVRFVEYGLVFITICSEYYLSQKRPSN